LELVVSGGDNYHDNDRVEPVCFFEMTERALRRRRKYAGPVVFSHGFRPFFLGGAVFFATFARERPDALFVAPNAFFLSRRVQIATLTAVNKIPAAHSIRDFVEAGGLMSYGTAFADMFHQVGVYFGSILKGAKPADLPVLQSTKFEFVINLTTAKALGIEVPAGVLSIADEVIE
jgi:hypothetical protein